MIFNQKYILISSIIIILIGAGIVVNGIMTTANTTDNEVMTTTANVMASSSNIKVLAKANTGQVASYTLADISSHDTSSNCWTAVDGDVYNITSYIYKHPGGPAIIRACGKDASAVFHSVGAHGSEDVQATLKGYLIGILA